jgi:hypothetical protein
MHGSLALFATMYPVPKVWPCLHHGGQPSHFALAAGLGISPTSVIFGPIQRADVQMRWAAGDALRAPHLFKSIMAKARKNSDKWPDTN